MKLFAALGPGDIVGARRSHEAGEHVAGETSILFSEQLVQYCRAADIALLGIGTNPRSDKVTHGEITLEQSPKPLGKSTGVLYHLGAILYAFKLAWRARRFRAVLAVIDSGTSHYFALVAFAFFRIPVAINFHNVLWPQGFRPNGLLQRLIFALDALFFRYQVVAITGCSPECHSQANQLAKRSLPYFEWRGQYRRSGFRPREHRQPHKPFKVAFAGRAEQSKGVLDIPLIAAAIEARKPGLVQFIVCGDGPALSLLREATASRGLQDVITIRGRLEREELLDVYAASDAVIVPTRGTFCEGLPLVCAEAVIAGLPIVTSRLSNALPVLGPAISPAEPEDVESFARAVEKIALDPKAYAALSEACTALAEQFFDRGNSYPAALDRLICLVLGKTPLPSYDELF